MRSLWQKKEYLAIVIIVILFVCISAISLSSISLLQGNSRVVNYVGIVRGATQKLVKEEIMGWYLSRSDALFADKVDWYPDDALVERLDSIIEDLLNGGGPNQLTVLHDEKYLENMHNVEEHWGELKELIARVRAGERPGGLFDSSQAYFDLVNETVFSAERYSERQVSHINRILVGVNVVFVLLIASGLILYARGLAVRRRAEILGQIAYVDPLTTLENRASCERLIERIRRQPIDGNIAAFMFDMNDLKLTNDFLGHQAGDKIISKFGSVLKEAGTPYGFVGRFGGDEFIAVFEPGDDAMAQAFLDEVQSEVDEYNEAQPNKLERIHYAVGYVIANARNQDIEDIIHDADNRMYENKRGLKGRR